MKQFEAPKLKVIYLANEDVIRASTCYDVECGNYICTDCVECKGTFECLGGVYCKEYTT